MDRQGQKQKGFSAHPVFSTLSGEDITVLSKLANLEHFPAGDTLFATDDISDCMYIVTSGEVSVLKTDCNSHESEIARLIPGDSLGEIDMISGTKRNVTARALTELSVIRFPPQNMSFRGYLEEHPATGSHILFAFIADIAERTRKANSLLKENSPQIQELRRQIYEDKLTNLKNKTFLEEQLPSILSSNEGETSLLMFKPDNFKQINDQAGHEAGDNLLVHLAHIFPSILPKDALLARYSGNEFAIVLAGKGKISALEMADKIKDFYNTLDVSRFLSIPGFHLTVSTGIGIYPVHAQNAADLIDMAHPLPLIGRALGGNKILFPEDNPEVKK